MEQQANDQARANSAGVLPPEPVVLPDVATAPHPSAHGNQAAGEGRLQEVLPEIKELAQKVGGFKNLSEIAGQLDRAGTGQ